MISDNNIRKFATKEFVGIGRPVSVYPIRATCVAQLLAHLSAGCAEEFQNDQQYDWEDCINHVIQLIEGQKLKRRILCQEIAISFFLPEPASSWE